MLRAVPPSCRLTWLWPSPPRFWYRLPCSTQLCCGLAFAPDPRIQVWSCRPSRGEFHSAPSQDSLDPWGWHQHPPEASSFRAQSLGESTIFRFRMLSAGLYLYLNVHVPTRKACVRPDRPALY